MSSKHREVYWCLVGSCGWNFGTAIGVSIYRQISTQCSCFREHGLTKLGVLLWGPCIRDDNSLGSFSGSLKTTTFHQLRVMMGFTPTVHLGTGKRRRNLACAAQTCPNPVM